MTQRLTFDQSALASGESCFRITMQAPRSNALEPLLLQDLHRAFDALEKAGAQKALLAGGRNFSSGGDVGRFLEASQNQTAQSYADEVVPVLQELVLRMIEMPVVFASAMRGAATGGAAGMIFASDIVAAAPDAFVQPYYGIMGFAPDGGWTAMLPELIGAGPAQSWLMTNQRHHAEALERLALVQAIDADPEARALTLLDGVETGTALTTKSLIWTEAARARVRLALDAEAVAFRNLIGRQETLSRMTKFLQPTG